MSKYIIGGGLSGLIAGYYNPGYEVIAPEYGGFIDNRYGRAFVVLHATEGMRQLFDEIDVKSFRKRIQIGYYDVGFVGTQLKTSLNDETEFAYRYVEEKLPERFTPGKGLELSAPGNSWEALFVDSSIVSALLDEVTNRRRGYIHDVSEAEMTLETEHGDPETVKWDEIVSTVPAMLFQRITDVSWDLDYEPTTYAELPREKVPERYLEKPWNILYTVDPAVEYHRVVRNMLSSRYYVECLGDVDVYGANDQMTNPNGVIGDTDISPPYDGITFLGRYAEWDHEKRIDHVINEAKSL